MSADNKNIDELRRIDVESAIAFFSIMLHRKDGQSVPTATVFADEMEPDDARRIFRVLLDTVTAEMNKIAQEKR